MKKNPKTLIVDDEEVAADLLETVLNKLGISDISAVYSGMEGVEEFERGLENGAPYKLVFLDIMMPGIDGQMILKLLRSAENEAGIEWSDRAAIIMTTALTSTESMVEALFDGDCSDYLVKPISLEYLRETLAKNGLI